MIEVQYFGQSLFFLWQLHLMISVEYEFSFRSIACCFLLNEIICFQISPVRRQLQLNVILLTLPCASEVVGNFVVQNKQLVSFRGTAVLLLSDSVIISVCIFFTYKRFPNILKQCQLNGYQMCKICLLNWVICCVVYTKIGLVHIHA